MSSEYSVRYDTRAGNELGKLPSNLAHRIFKKITKSKRNPGRYWLRLEGRADYRLRIGDYRAVADIDHKSKTIYVTKIGQRDKIYERL